MKTPFVDYFPLPEIRPTQEAVLKEIQSVFESGKNFIILESPVGSGKSGIAIALARAAESAHVITPRKTLQNQYFDDFDDHIVLMKGRNAYPCTYESTPNEKKKIITMIQAGSVPAPNEDESCAKGPCKDSPAMFDRCVGLTGPCPYKVAIDVAQKSDIVVHNLHSFIYQTKFVDTFFQREILIVDEAHEIEGVLREFITKEFTSLKSVKLDTLPEGSDLDDWKQVLLSDDFVPVETSRDRHLKANDEAYLSERDKYFLRINELTSETIGKMTVRVRENVHGLSKKTINLTVQFVPHSLGQAPKYALFSYGQKVVLMSGTIYDKNVFCKNLGINPNEAHFIRVPSTFPVKNRPVYLKSNYQVDTSFAKWNENLEEIASKIYDVMNVFKDVKGLIHSPSYFASRQLDAALNSPRIMIHEPYNFQSKLEEFYASKEPKVFMSPTCQQGVDFKEDRARFQIILRVPYFSTSDKFIEDKVKEDFPWYNYQALVVFGQQLGRVNRSEKDFGVTILMDRRFNQFVSKNSSKLPKWQKDAFVFK